MSTPDLPGRKASMTQPSRPRVTGQPQHLHSRHSMADKSSTSAPAPTASTKATANGTSSNPRAGPVRLSLEPSQRRTPMGPPAARPATRADAQLATLRALRCEERDLCRRLHRLLHPPAPLRPHRAYLPSTHAHTQPDLGLTDAQRGEVLREAKAVVGEHIARLGRYNEIRDVGMGLIGIVADMRCERVRDVQGEFGVGHGD
jgi:hypothetical protein